MDNIEVVVEISQVIGKIIFDKNRSEITPLRKPGLEDHGLTKSFCELQYIFNNNQDDDYESATIRDRCFKTIMLLDDEYKLTFLLSMLYNKNDLLRASACEFLGHFDVSISRLSVTAKLLLDESGDVRYAAAEAMELIGDINSLPILEWVVNNDDGMDSLGYKISLMAESAINSINSRSK